MEKETVFWQIVARTGQGDGPVIAVVYTAAPVGRQEVEVSRSTA